MASINLQGDTSGSISISAPSVAGTNTLTLPATTQTLATQNALGVRNLIINGDMRIHQRGGTVNQTTSNPYSLDRWKGYGDVNSTFSMQQSSDAPADFTNSLLVTVLSTQASGWYSLEQVIEGYNITHLNWGTSNAKDITVSFWVKSSVTGTFGGTLRNPSSTFYSYAFEYTINSANTWEQKTVTISGPTVGTWGTGNSSGLHIFFGLSTGSITAGSWQVANSNSSSSSIQFVNNAGATWQITGVQLEADTDTATPFEHRPYDMELARCQRYYFKNKANNTADAISSFGEIYNTANGQVIFILPVPMRVPFSSYSVEWQDVQALVPSTGSYTVTGLAIANGTYTTVLLNFVSSGMTAGKNPYLRTSSVNGYIAISGEL